MTENEWTQDICDKLKPFLKENNLYAETLIKLPYVQEIIGYTSYLRYWIMIGDRKTLLYVTKAIGDERD